MFVERFDQRGAGRTLRWLRNHSALVSVALMGGLVGLPFRAVAEPTGGSVVSGGATITYSGPDTTITQTTGGAVINWQDFSVGAGETVRFDQPSASSVTLNRVTTHIPSDIAGEITATGNVWIENRNGVFIGQGATINVGGGFMATTAHISDAAFEEGLETGAYTFSGAPAGSAVINGGAITAGEGGVVLVAPVVDNYGFIETAGGDVLLGAAQAFTVDFAGDGLLQYSVDGSGMSLTHSGSTVAQGGAVFMSASTAGDVTAGVVSIGGAVEATRIENRGGVIVLEGGATGAVEVDGALTAHSGAPDGGDGGEITITGESVHVAPGAVIDASGTGAAGDGGTVRIGGDYQGGGETRRSISTVVNYGSVVRADGSGTGSGGTVIAWSDGNTGFAGEITATGGAAGGDGGLVEVSGLENLAFLGHVDVSAAFGENGTILLDPDSITIGNTGTNNAALPTILAADGAGTDYEISVGALEGLSGNVLLQATGDIDITQTMTNNNGASFTLEAGGSISVSNNVNFTTGGTITFAADAAAVGANGSGNISIGNGSLVSATGGITFTTGLTDGTITFGNNSTLAASGGIVSLQTTGALAIEAITAAGVSITATDFVTGSGDSLNVGGGIVNFIHATAGGDFTIGDDGASTFAVSGTDLSRITAGTATFTTTSGDIVLGDHNFDGLALQLIAPGGTVTVPTDDIATNIGALNVASLDVDVVGSIVVTGAAAFVNSGGDDVLIGGTASAAAGTYDFDSDDLLSIVATGGLSFSTTGGTMTVAAGTDVGASALALTNSGGLIDVTGAVSAGSVSFTALDVDIAALVTADGGAGTVSFTNAGTGPAGGSATFGGAGDAVATTFDLTDTELETNLSAGTISMTTQGALTVTSTDTLDLGAGTLILDSYDAVSLIGGTTDFAASLTVGTLTVDGSGVTQSGGALTVSGTTTATGNNGAVTLTGVANDFGTVVASGTTVSIADAGAIALGDITSTTGGVTVTAGGAVTQGAATTLTSASGLTINTTDATMTDSASVTLDQGIAVAGTIGGAIEGTFTAVSAGALDFGTLTATGATVAASDVSIATAFNVGAGMADFTTAAGTTTFELGGLGDAVATTFELTDAELDRITAGALTFGAGALATDIDGVTLGATPLTVTTTGAVTFTGVNTFADALTVTGSTITDVLGASVGVTGAADFNATTLITLDSATNNFTSIDLSGTGLQVADLGGLTVAGVSGASGAGAATSLTLGTTGALDFAGTVSTGTLTVTGATAVTQSAGTITATGAASFASATAGAVTLTQTGNDFASVGSSGALGAVTLVDSDGITLDALTAAALTVTATDIDIAGAQTITGAVAFDNSAGNDVFLGSGGTASEATFDLSDAELDLITATSLTVDSNGGNVAVEGVTNTLALFSIDAEDAGLTNRGSIDFTGVNSFAALTLDGNSGVTQSGGSVSVTGTATLNSTGSVTFGQAGVNDFTTVTGTATAYTIDETGGLSLSGLTATSGGLTVDSTGTVVIPAGTTASATGAVALTTTAGVTIGTGGVVSGQSVTIGATHVTSFPVSGMVAGGAITATGGNVDLNLTTGATSLGGDVTATGGITIDSTTGSISVVDGVSIDAAGALAINSTGSTVTTGATSTLEGASVTVSGVGVTTGIVNATSGAVDIDALGAGPLAILGQTTAGTTIDLNAVSGAVTVASGVTVDATGALTVASTGGVVSTGATSRLEGATVSLSGTSVTAGITNATTGAVDVTATTGAALLAGLTTAATTVDVTAATLATLTGGSGTALNVTAQDVAFQTATFTVGSGTGTATFTNSAGDLTTVGGAADADPTTFELSTADLALLSAGTVAVDSNGGALTLNAVNLGTTQLSLDVQDATLTTTGAVNFVGASSFANLIIGASTSITQALGSSVSVTGTATLNSTGAVSLGLAANDFGNVTGTAASYLLADTGGVTLSGLTATAGDITVNSTGAIFVAAGTTTQATGGVSLTSTGIGAVVGTTGNGVIRADSDTSGAGTLLLSAASGTVTGGAGSVFDGAVVTLTGRSVTTSGTVTASAGAVDIDATTGATSIGGDVSATAGITIDSTTGSITVADGVRVDAVDALAVTSTGGTISTGAATTLEGSTVTVSGVGVTTGIVNATSGAVDIDATTGPLNLTGLTTAATTIDVNSTSGAISVTDGVTVDATGALMVASTGGTVTTGAGSTLEGTSVTVSGVGVTTGIVNATTGAVDIDATTGALNLTGLTTAATTIDVNSTSGAISVTDGVRVDAVGALTIGSTGGTVTSGSASTLEGSTVTVSGVGVTTGIVNATAGAVDIDATTGALNLTGLTTAATTIDVNSTTGAITVSNGVTVDATGALTVVSTGGSVTTGAGSTLEGTGVTVAGTSVTTGIVNATAGAVDIDSTAGAINLLSTVTATGAVSVDAVGGSLEMAGRTITADTDGTGAEALTLSSSVNILGAGSTLQGGSVQASATNLTLGTVTSTGGGIQIAATGASGVVVDGTLTAATLLDIDAVAGIVSIAGAVNAGAVDIDTTGAGTSGADVLFSSTVNTTGAGGTTGNIEVTTVGGDITASDVLTTQGTPGNILLSSTTGAITTTTMNSAGSISATAGGAVSTGAINAGTAVRLASTSGGVTLGGDIIAGGADPSGVSVDIDAGTFVVLNEVTAGGDLLVNAGTRIALRDDLTVNGGSIVLTAADSFGEVGGPRVLPGNLVITAIPADPVPGSGIRTDGNVTFNVGQGFSIIDTTPGADDPFTVILRDPSSQLPALPAALGSFGEFRILVGEGTVAVGTAAFVDAADEPGFNPFTFTGDLTDSSELFRVEGHFGLVGLPSSPTLAPSFHVQNTSGVPNEGAGTFIAGQGRLGGTFASISLFGEVNGQAAGNVAFGGFVQINTIDPSLPVFSPIPEGTANGCVILQFTSCQPFGITIPVLEIEEGDLLNIRFVDPEEEEDDPFTNRGDEEQWEG